ncbi:MAG: hypothetical protein Q9193_005948, partial [Seirophora villosa]
PLRGGWLSATHFLLAAVDEARVHSEPSKFWVWNTAELDGGLRIHPGVSLQNRRPLQLSSPASMAILNDVEVRVVTKANKQQLTEYDKPDTGATAEKACVERYIEAKTGEDFQIEVYFKEGFDCFGAWGVEVGIDIDRGVVGYCERYSKGSVSLSQLTNEPITFDSVYHCEGSLVSDVGFRFASLNLGKCWTVPIMITLTLNGIDENTDSSREVLEAQAEKLGVIEIVIDRVNRKRLPKPEERGVFYKPLESVDVSKELIKDKHISNIMQ